MPEQVGVWWARRQWSRGAFVPYPVGAFRAAWAPYPVLIRQYHPEANSGVTLTQIPPTAEVWVTWECEVGHVFIATPAEQRARPGRERRRSVWCPECAALAVPRRWPVRPADWPSNIPDPQRVVRTTGRQTLPAGGARVSAMGLGGPSGAIPSTGVGVGAGRGSVASAGGGPGCRGRGGTKRERVFCARTPLLPAGTPFHSVCAPPTASAAEAALRAGLRERLDLTFDRNAVRLRTPFFDHLEAWPDIVLPELRVAIEYDTPGRHGLEHVGGREDADRRKDRLLRAVGWEVLRLRTGRLEPIGPWDITLSGVSVRGLDAIVERLRDMCGPLFVDAYRR